MLVGRGWAMPLGWSLLLALLSAQRCQDPPIGAPGRPLPFVEYFSGMVVWGLPLPSPFSVVEIGVGAGNSTSLDWGCFFFFSTHSQQISLDSTVEAGEVKRSAILASVPFFPAGMAVAIFCSVSSLVVLVILGILLRSTSILSSWSGRVILRGGGGFIWALLFVCGAAVAATVGLDGGGGVED